VRALAILLSVIFGMIIFKGLLELIYHLKLITMLRWTVIFLVVAIIAAVFGFGGIAAGAAGIAKVLFFIFIVLFLISLIAGRRSV
jgi:uncharacterized membrane protein YtjA (UPF0391 family)